MHLNQSTITHIWLAAAVVAAVLRLMRQVRINTLMQRRHESPAAVDGHFRRGPGAPAAAWSDAGSLSGRVRGPSEGSFRSVGGGVDPTAPSHRLY